VRRTTEATKPRYAHFAYHLRSARRLRKRELRLHLPVTSALSSRSSGLPTNDRAEGGLQGRARQTDFAQKNSQLPMPADDWLCVMKQTTFALGLLSMGVVACSGDPGAQTAGTPQESLLDVCEGEFLCEVPGADPVPTRLSRSADGCYAGKLRLVADGRTYVSETTIGTWRGTTSEFLICDDTLCLVCRPADSSPPAASAPAPSAARCVGSAYSCATYAGGACIQEGCSFQFKVQSNGDLKPDCTGSAKPCEDFDREPDCARQEGCSWH
jgi:hypothetical protein